jgi:hypothetical protein
MPNRESGGAISFYYSDWSSTVPVREVRRKDDNKADPNLETRTYGLFSTCERYMRAGVVKRGIEYVFFCTRREDVRVLTGYYRIGWFHKGPKISGYGGGDDFMLAASECRFVSPGFPLRDLKGYLNGVRLDKRFRTFKYIDAETAKKLLDLLREAPDATEEYVSEIRRLESLNVTEFGYAYKNWKRVSGFDWESARRYLEGT